MKEVQEATIAPVAIVSLQNEHQLARVTKKLHTVSQLRLSLDSIRPSAEMRNASLVILTKRPRKRSK